MICFSFYSKVIQTTLSTRARRVDLDPVGSGSLDFFTTGSGSGSDKFISTGSGSGSGSDNFNQSGPSPGPKILNKSGPGSKILDPTGSTLHINFIP